MNEHSIKIKIAGRIYPQTVSEDNEAVIRQAAHSVDEVIREYTKVYPGVSQVDIATIVALNAAMETAELKQRMEQLEKQIEEMSGNLQRYVDSLK